MSIEADARRYKKYLKSLTSAVRHSLASLDDLMRQPESHARGKKIAQVSNFLEMENDKARYFGLGIDFRKDRKSK